MERLSAHPDRSGTSWVWVVALWVMACGPAFGQPAGEPSPPEALSITAEVMTVRGKENKAVFETGVVIRKGELTITADRVEVFLDPEARKNGGSESINEALSGASLESGAVSQLRAAGHVTFQQGDRRAESQEALYDRAQDTVTLTGDPVLYEKDYSITGSRMVFYLKENRSTVEESRVLFNPAGKENP